ncbi:MAG: hypothetical protein C0392_15960 [Syntrophus sp. (in: bacteria)]|nr:hypothetical protein [Syntrophus sp. (in: bacteria)]
MMGQREAREDNNDEWKDRQGKNMKKIMLVTLLLIVLGFSSVAHAALITSIDRSVIGPGGTYQNSSLGTFQADASGWQSSQVSPPEGTVYEQRYSLATQNTSIQNSNGVLTVQGSGVGTGDPYRDTIGVSTLTVTFTPQTNATFSWSGSYWPTTNFSGDPADLGLSHTLIANQSYTVHAFTSWATSNNWTISLTVTEQAAPVPIPPTLWLLGSGLIGLVGLRRKFKK